MSRQWLIKFGSTRDIAKRIAVFILASLGLFLLIWLVQCSNKAQPSPSETGVSQTETSADATDPAQFVIGISEPNFAEPWRMVAKNQFEEAAAAYPEFKLIITDGRLDNNKQISDIQSFIDQKVDLIIVSPNEAKPLTEVITKAYNAGIPVIVVDRHIEGEAYTQYIGADNWEIGYMAGKWAASCLGSNGGNIVELTGEAGTSAQIDRHEGFMEAIQENPNIHVIASQSMDWIYDRSIPVMEAMLNKYDDIDVVFAHNDAGAEGAYKAAQAVGREKEMKFIGIDGLPTPSGGIMSVISGRLSVTYLYPTGSEEAIDSAYKLLVKKQKIDRQLTLDTMEITLQNAQEVYDRLNGLGSTGNQAD